MAMEGDALPAACDPLTAVPMLSLLPACFKLRWTLADPGSVLFSADAGYILFAADLGSRSLFKRPPRVGSDEDGIATACLEAGELWQPLLATDFLTEAPAGWLVVGRLVVGRLVITPPPRGELGERAFPCSV